ncbi:Dabb family protein [Euryhalocaulis caribicus]|uniref:Dabb family protein n=1 Tax=Euryhalocaulis caribicus TaxID=1161401 RepID=UPI0003A86B95|nr:Dabb family protein [Euryhalocaulis caribicus]
MNPILMTIARRALPSALLVSVLTGPMAVMAQETGPTIYHSVRMDLRDDADPEAVQAVLDLMVELGEGLDVVQSFVVGPDLSEDYDIGATYVLVGYEAFRTYMYDPLHLQIDRNGLPLVQNMVSFDITDAEDKQEAQAAIARIHADRIEDVPGLKELLEEMESYGGPGTE